jgi:hypothetical protein
MPKIVKDDLLQDKVRALVQAAGSYAAAARMLDINKVTIWRFHETGCAIDRTRVAIKEALRRVESEINNKKSVTDNAGNVTNSLGKKTDLQVPDLRMIRAFCQSMIALVDAYESIDTGSTNATKITAGRGTASDDPQSGRRN